MVNYKKYQGDVCVGDVVMSESDCKNAAAFATCMVTKINKGMVRLERPHARVCAVTNSMFLSTESFEVPLVQFVLRYCVLVTGPSGKVDNRVM